MRFVAILLTMLSLSGCAATSIPQAADSSDVEAFLARRLDAQWKDAGLDDGQRPDVERVRLISNADFTTVMSKCATELTPGYGQVLSNATTVARLVYYTCEAMYPVDPAEYVVLSTAQIDYLYDYYRRWTIPCVRAHGYAVGGVPSRTAFLLMNGLWNPIYHSGSDVELSRAAYQRVASECDFDVVSRFPTG